MRPIRRRSVRGSALLLTVVSVVVLTALSAAILAVTASSQRESRSASEEIRALYLAETATSDLITSLRVELRNPTGPAGNPAMPVIGSAAAPRSFASGAYYGSVVDNGDGTYTLTSTGVAGSATQTIEVVVDSLAFGIFANAVFAGNTDGTPNYALDFGGQGTQGDEIQGDVYSGGDIGIRQDADVRGRMRATGTITGGSGLQGISQPIPDIAAMDYPNVHDVDVAGAFQSDGVWRSSSLGGSAHEVPADNPAHIFRKNPSDRSADIAATPKDDFFLEDPYEGVHLDPQQDGRDATHISLTGGPNPGPDGNNLMYFVDGNLWLHNKDTYSFKLTQPGSATGVRVTFVVRGNIYFSDNLFLLNKNKDAVAFIAIKDPAEPDSGNIYFGDPTYGTLKEMNAFLYAENDFYDHNLDASGSSEVHLRGIMSAGNQVDIQRDFRGQHSKLTVEFDDRVWTGKVELPGLPGSSGAGGGGTVLSWRRVPTL